MFKRVTRALRRHGFANFCRLVVYNVGYYLRHLGRPETDPVGRSLDAARGIETSSIREVGSLDIESPNVRHAVRYQPTGVDLIRRILRDSGIDYSGVVLVDFGCGKGRVMLLAAEFPFQRIIGVEFSPELYEIAQRNIAACAGRFTRCRDVHAILGDAAEFEPPGDPLVCYFYNPFGLTVMRDVAGNLERSLQKKPRNVWIIYVDPQHRKVFDDGPWSPFKEDCEYVIYRSRL